jgi:hypothetical protein
VRAYVPLNASTTAYYRCGYSTTGETDIVLYGDGEELDRVSHDVASETDRCHVDPAQNDVEVTDFSLNWSQWAFELDVAERHLVEKTVIATPKGEFEMWKAPALHSPGPIFEEIAVPCDPPHEGDVEVTALGREGQVLDKTAISVEAVLNASEGPGTWNFDEFFDSPAEVEHLSDLFVGDWEVCEDASK